MCLALPNALNKHSRFISDCDTGFQIGSKVVRNSEHWPQEVYGDEDGGKGSIGVVTSKVGSDQLQQNGWIQVKWENGKQYAYRWGKDGKTDVKIFCSDKPLGASNQGN